MADGCDDPRQIDDLARLVDRGVAVAVQGEVVPRAEWVTMCLRNGDRIEVVGAIQGG